MKSKAPIGLYFVVGILGVVAGVANLLQQHYLFGAIYGLFGALWLLMATVKSRAAAPSASGPLDSGQPDRKPSQS